MCIKIVDKVRGNVSACKIISKRGKNLKNLNKNGIEIHSTMDHRNIVKLLASFEDEKKTVYRSRTLSESITL